MTTQQQPQPLSMPAKCGIGIVGGAVVGHALRGHPLTLALLIVGGLTSRLWSPPLQKWLDSKAPPTK